MNVSYCHHVSHWHKPDLTNILSVLKENVVFCYNFLQNIYYKTILQTQIIEWQKIWIKKVSK